MGPPRVAVPAPGTLLLAPKLQHSFARAQDVSGSPGGPTRLACRHRTFWGWAWFARRRLECDGGERKIRNYSDKNEYAMHTPHITPKAHPLWAQEAVSEICRAAH